MRPTKSTPIAAAVLSLLVAGAATGSDYEINRMSNGGFEVVWPTPGCIASYNAKGQSMHSQAYKDGYLAGENAR